MYLNIGKFCLWCVCVPELHGIAWSTYDEWDLNAVNFPKEKYI